MWVPIYFPLVVLLVAAVVTWAVDAWLLDWFKSRQVKAQIRKQGPESHQSKAKTPAMGGAAFPLGYLVAFGTGIALLALTDAPLVPPPMAAPRGYEVTLATPAVLGRIALCILIPTLAFLIGFADDYLKVQKESSDGLKARYKLPLQLAIGALLGAMLAWGPSGLMSPSLLVGPPLFESAAVVFIWAMLLFAGTVNAVNFTDGLDGLLVGTGAVALLVLGGIGLDWFLPHRTYDAILGLAGFAGAGTLLGFYPHNRHPAKMFMGDGGAYFIGALLGTLALLEKVSFLFLIIGDVFFLELLSVVLQVSVFRLSGGKKRLFPMTPLHHSFEVKGWPEERVVGLFWAMALGFAVLAVILAPMILGGAVTL